MELKVFVVETELKKLNGEQSIKAYFKLLKLQTDLIKLFNGLTELKNVVGYWINDKGLIESDNVSLWLIYTDKTELINNESVLLWDVWNKFTLIIEEIKALTMQKTQMYTVNEKAKFT